MTFAHDGLTDADFRDMESEPEPFTNPTDNTWMDWEFPITPQQISHRFWIKIKNRVEHICEHWEITDEPVGPWSVSRHIRHEDFEDLEKLETKAFVCAMFWDLKAQEEVEENISE